MMPCHLVDRYHF